jgi:hypothetical protein
MFSSLPGEGKTPFPQKMACVHYLLLLPPQVTANLNRGKQQAFTVKVL